MYKRRKNTHRPNQKSRLLPFLLTALKADQSSKAPARQDPLPRRYPTAELVVAAVH